MAAESYNSERTSGDQAMKRQCGEGQASLKPALVLPYMKDALTFHGSLKGMKLNPKNFMWYIYIYVLDLENYLEMFGPSWCG